MKSRSSTSLLIISVIACLASFALYLFATNVVNGKIDNAVSAQSNIVAEETKQKNENSLIAIMKNTYESRDKLKGYFVSDDKVVSFIEEVESIGTTAGNDLSLSSIDADTSALATGEVGTIKAHVSATGSWISVMKSLRLVENLPYQISVDNVRLDRGGDVKAPTWKIDFDIKVLAIKS